MLWLCISLPQLPLEAIRADEPDRAIVVTSCEGSARWIVCCNAWAERVHLNAAMNYTVALAIHPHVLTLERKPAAEQAALERLAAWSYQFSSHVIAGDISKKMDQARNAALWLEIGASLKLFGGFRPFIEHVEKELGLLDYTYRLGIAPTLEGAALLARSGIRLAITHLDALYLRIRGLPTSALGLQPDLVEQLQASGVRRLGMLLELPRDAVAKRFGPPTRNLLDRLMGQAPDPRPAFRLPDTYRASFEFELEVKSTEALLFPLRRMLREFAGFLRARDTGVQHFTLSLSHRQQPPTQLHVGLATPDRNAERFFAVVREQLERTELPAPTLELSLRAAQFAAPTSLQPDLFNGALQQTETFSHTLERMAARLGEAALHGLKPVAEHRPEASWTATSLNEKSPEAAFPPRPLWLLPEPKPLQFSVLPSIVSGPERIESGWWDGGDAQRDYFVVRTGNGADLWIFKDLTDGSWHLHGFWS
jgi:protein ImuB